jgi:hypothetical protein
LLCPLPKRNLSLCRLPYLLGIAEGVDGVIKLSEGLLSRRIDFGALSIGEVFAILVRSNRRTIRSRILLSAWWMGSRQIALSYRPQVIVKLRDMCSLVKSVTIALEHVVRNVAYNAVCLLQKLVQVLHTKNIRLDWLCIMPH